MCVEYRVAAYQDAFAGPLPEGTLAGARLEADAVVSHIYAASCHQDVFTEHKVYAVSVLGVPRTAHRHAVDDYLAAALRHEVEFGRILQSDPLYEHPLAVGEAYKVRTCPLLRLVV